MTAAETTGDTRELPQDAHAGRMDEVAAGLGIGRRTLSEKILKLCLDKECWPES